MFCYPAYIPREMDRLFANLKQLGFFRNATIDAFIAGAAHFLAELNAIHAFREDNGRTQTTFIVLLALRAGRTVDLDLLHPGRFLAAMIASFNGSEQALRTELRGFVS